ncbi:hypothetical protein [Lactiplantibacillus pingfangensis]|uniref:hypothetical protein n=1 Tax=Lactiplantibacillus pingfangensis TaxID=2559915 RepID=UPI0010F84E7B|nr:hypothetical protein [Lactiplantibacillus pingfangensis]
MVYIKEVLWLDSNTREAFVVLSDGCNELVCFSDSFNQGKGEAFFGKIYEFEAGFAWKQVAGESCSLARLKKGTDHAYTLFGKITKDWNLQLGQFVIDMPADAFKNCNVADYVGIEVMRLDMEDS